MLCVCVCTMGSNEPQLAHQSSADYTSTNLWGEVEGGGGGATLRFKSLQDLRKGRGIIKTCPGVRLSQVFIG